MDRLSILVASYDEVQHILMLWDKKVYKDKTNLLEGLAEGDEVEVSFNVRGNEYNGRYYVNLQAWKLQKQDDGMNQEAPPAPDFEPVGDDDDDLPF